MKKIRALAAQLKKSADSVSALLQLEYQRGRISTDPRLMPQLTELERKMAEVAERLRAVSSSANVRTVKLDSPNPMRYQHPEADQIRDVINRRNAERHNPRHNGEEQAVQERAN